jgi:molybdopterin converting factor small subunit
LTEEELGIVLINGRHAWVERVLQEGDTLSLFPLVGGG